MDTNKQKQLPKLSEYNKKEYWNERFTNEEDYEWLVSYQEVRQQLDLAIESKDKKVVIIGCGNSSIGSDMVEHGYNDIHNIDYSSKVIQKMKTRHPKQNYAEMDIRDLQYADGSVDVILDKATIDSLQVDIKDPLNVEQSILDDLENVLLGCHRVLKADGVLIMISFQQPHLRRKIIERECYQWIVEVQKIEKGFGYFMYVCRKVDKAKFDIELQARKEKEEERQKQMEEYEEMKKQNRVDLEDESQFDIFKMQVD